MVVTLLKLCSSAPFWSSLLEVVILPKPPGKWCPSPVRQIRWCDTLVCFFFNHVHASTFLGAWKFARTWSVLRLSFNSSRGKTSKLHCSLTSWTLSRTLWTYKPIAIHGVVFTRFHETGWKAGDRFCLGYLIGSVLIDDDWIDMNDKPYCKSRRIQWNEIHAPEKS